MASDLAADERTRHLDALARSARRSARPRRNATLWLPFCRHCGHQQKFADAEIERIEKRKAFIASVQEELESYIVQVIEQFATPDRQGVQRLEGNVSSMRIQKNPDSVLITDVNAIPLA